MLSTFHPYFQPEFHPIRNESRQIWKKRGPIPLQETQYGVVEIFSSLDFISFVFFIGCGLISELAYEFPIMLGLYAWGANSHGQLGLGFASEMVCEPQRVDELPAQLCESAITCIVGGGGHTLLLTKVGALYGAGWNHCGQVGEGSASRCVPLFRECRGLEDQTIIGVACGWAHSVACSTSGNVWVWGSNSHGQLGLPPDEVPFSSLPICLELSNVTCVAAGLRHTVVATRAGAVYSWGQGQRGQLGHLNEDGLMLKTLSVPRLLTTLETKVTSVVCGQNMTYAITAEGTLVAWGDNKWGQLAHDPRNLMFFTCPLPIPCNYFGGERISWIKCGWTHCVACTSSGALYCWGRADYGQLGPKPPDDDDLENPVLGREPCCNVLRDSDGEEEEKLPKYRFIPSLLTVGAPYDVDQLVCGSEHTLALLVPASPSGPRGKTHLLRRQSLPSKTSPQIFLIQSMNEKRKHDTLPRIETSSCLDNAYSSTPPPSSIFSPLRPSTPLNSASLETVATDSDSVSSASNSSSALKESAELLCISNSPPSDACVNQHTCQLALPSLKNVRLGDFDEPCTLSPIDSPRAVSHLPVGSVGKSNQLQCRVGGSLLESAGSTENCAENRSTETSSPRGARQSTVALQSKSDLHPDDKHARLEQRASLTNAVGGPSCSPMHRAARGGIYSWGWNEHGNCGLGTTTNVTLPQRVPVEGKVLLVGAGSGHSFALIRNCTKVAL